VAIGQACAHLYYDIDRIELPLPKRRTDSTSEVDLAAPPALVRIRKSLLRILSQQLAVAICVPVISTPIYFLFLRTELWQWHLFFAKLLVTSQIRPTSAPHSIWPPYFLSLVLRSISSNFLLLALWNVSHEIFGAYVSLQPLKKGQPLTAESRDPNGSLISGVKAKRDVPRVCWYIHG
jgi:nucleoporin NDC1